VADALLAEYPSQWEASLWKAFAFLGFEFLKFIGDEVMMFMPLAEGEAPGAAKTIYDFVVRNGWYLEQLNLFNPASIAERGSRSKPSPTSSWPTRASAPP
jgi:hypothetical protein